MGGMQREFERMAHVFLTANQDGTLLELQKLEELGALNSHLIAQILETMKSISPHCKCGEDYFEHIAPHCVECALVRVERDIYEEELGMCVECSNAYYTHEDEEVTG